MTERNIYLCEDSLEGIFSGVYQAYEDRHGHPHNEIRVASGNYNRELFCRYITVEEDFIRAEKVARTVQRDISREAFHFLQRAAVSWQPEKADAIYRFIIDGLKMGNKILRYLTAPYMQTLCAIEKSVNNEILHFKEFLRFEELQNGVLFGRINPKSEVLPFMAEHFADRFSGEDWIIADTPHQKVLIHKKNQGCLYASMQEADFDELDLSYSEEEESMQSLWKMYVDTIAIRERVNPNLQRQLLPLRFRKYMKEFRKP